MGSSRLLLIVGSLLSSGAAAYASPTGAPPTAQVTGSSTDAGILPRMRRVDARARITDDLLAGPTTIDVRVAATYASATIRRRFTNPFDEQISTRIGFHLPPGASLLDLELRSGERRSWTVQEPRPRTYNWPRRAVELGEEQRAWPGGYQRGFVKLPAWATVDSAMRYTTPLAVDGRRFTLALPTRAETVRCHETDGACPARPVTVTIAVHAGLPIVDWSTPGHAAVGALEDGRLTVTLADGDRRPDRDLTLHYTVGGEALATGVVVHRDAAAGQDHVALVVHPPADAPRPEPREVIFAIDVSASLRGWLTAVGRPLVRRILRRLGPDDTFDIVVFGRGSARVFDGPAPVTPASIATAEFWLRVAQHQGGEPAPRSVEAVLATPAAPDRDRHVVLLTDGRVREPAALLDAARDHAAAQRAAGRDGRVFVFMSDDGLDRCLLNGLAAEGRGDAYRLDAPGTAPIDRMFRHIDRPVLTELTVDWGGPAPDAAPDVPDLLPGRPLVVHHRVSGAAPRTLTLRGRRAGRIVERTVAVAVTAAPGTTAHPGLVEARAIDRIDALSVRSGDAALTGAIEALAVRHGVPSPVTRLAGFDTEVKGSTKSVATLAVQRRPSDAVVWPHYTNAFDEEVGYDPDGDGIDSRVDQCPTEAEDFDTVADHDGCPDPGPAYDQPDEDADRDGVVDLYDACPLHPESHNGVRDSDGCPDAPLRACSSGDLEYFRPPTPIRFEPGTSIPTPASAPALDAVAQHLEIINGIQRMRIAAHTDARGSDGANQRLSAQRAEAVKRALVERGIDAARLEPKGMGELTPVADNRTAAGRAANRRVEFEVVAHDVKIGCMPLLVYPPVGARRALPPAPPPPPPPPIHAVPCPGTWTTAAAPPSNVQVELVVPSAVDGAWWTAVQADARACSALASTRSPGLSGEVDVRIDRGVIERVAGLSDPQLLTCLQGRADGWPEHPPTRVTLRISAAP